MTKVVVITGGVKSGKSSYALKLTKNYNKVCFIATAIPFDKEMELRIKRHKTERDSRYYTIESPYDIESHLLKYSDMEAFLIDCITLYINNLLFKNKNLSKEEISQKALKLRENISNTTAKKIVIVTNEVGLGVIPDNDLARKYIELLGIYNQLIVSFSDEVFLMVSGVPVRIK